MKSITIELPELSEIKERDVKLMLAGQLYEDERLTLGQAAHLAGLSKRTFIEIIGQFGFSIFSKSVDDLHNDIKNA